MKKNKLNMVMHIINLKIPINLVITRIIETFILVLND